LGYGSTSKIMPIRTPYHVLGTPNGVTATET